MSDRDRQTLIDAMPLKNGSGPHPWDPKGPAEPVSDEYRLQGLILDGKLPPDATVEDARKFLGLKPQREE